MFGEQLITQRSSVQIRPRAPEERRRSSETERLGGLEGSRFRSAKLAIPTRFENDTGFWPASINAWARPLVTAEKARSTSGARPNAARSTSSGPRLRWILSGAYGWCAARSISPMVASAATRSVDGSRITSPSPPTVLMRCPAAASTSD